MMGATQSARSPAGDPNERIVRINFISLPTRDVRGTSAVANKPSFFSANTEKVLMVELPATE